MLLEALIAILIFSMGILAIVGMQAASIKQMSDAKYRTDANMLANQLIGQMWVSDRTAAALATNFGTGGAGYQAWLGDTGTPGSVAATLPGTDTNPPTVTVTQIPGTNPPTTASSQVTVRVFWLQPGETVPHSHIAIAQIK